MDDIATIQHRIKQYVLGEFLPGENPDELTERTPLLTSGILDSIATLKLVSFLEEAFSISLAAHETDAEHLDTLERIASLVKSKQ